MGLRAIIFDMDGVLVDSEPTHFEATCRLLAGHGVTYAPDENENFYGCTDRDVFRALRARYGLAATEEALAEAWIGLVVDLLPGSVGPMAGVPDVLVELGRRGFRLALASSSSRPIIETTLRVLSVDGTFETTVSGRDVPRGKPDPDIFLEAARRLEVPAGECLVIEDSQNGLRAAHAAGMPCVVVPCHSTRGQDFSLATTRLESLRELPMWIERTYPAATMP
jgi:HAD superfamily hydrolase (TIGR01509 family)